MNTQVLEQGGVTFVECIDGIGRVDDAIDLISTCLGHKTRRLMIESARFPDAFFDLHSRFAGEFIGKLQIYRFRTAVVFPAEAEYGETFEAFLTETRRGSGFRTFTDRSEAEAWLCSE